jgi:hypothetical protein
MVGNGEGTFLTVEQGRENGEDINVGKGKVKRSRDSWIENGVLRLGIKKEKS